MKSPIFLDTNVQVYAAGRPHDLKEPCLQVVALVAEYPQTFVTDAEVLQELLRRYLAIRTWDPQGKESFDSFADLMQERVEPVHAADVVQAAELVSQHPRMEARDLLHLAVMRRLGVTRVVSADKAFDLVPDVMRLDPARFESWVELIVA